MGADEVVGCGGRDTCIDNRVEGVRFSRCVRLSTFRIYITGPLFKGERGSNGREVEGSGITLGDAICHVDSPHHIGSNVDE